MDSLRRYSKQRKIKKLGKQIWKGLLSNTKAKSLAELEPMHKIKQRSKRFPGITVTKLIPDKGHLTCGRDPDFST